MIVRYQFYFQSGIGYSLFRELVFLGVETIYGSLLFHYLSPTQAEVIVNLTLQRLHSLVDCKKLLLASLLACLLVLLSGRLLNLSGLLSGHHRLLRWCLRHLHLSEIVGHLLNWRTHLLFLLDLESLCTEITLWLLGGLVELGVHLGLGLRL